MDCPKRRRDTEAAASGLPDDPLLEILSRIPAESLCRWKCVSNAWRDLITDPLHRKKLPQALQGFFFMVKLHVCHGESGCDEPCACHGGDGEPKGDEDSDKEELSRYGFVDVLRRWVRLVDFELTELTELPGIRNSRLVHCCNGLLLFAVKGSWWNYVVCNPATGQCVGVPSSSPDVSQWDTFYGSAAATYLFFDPGGDPCHFNLVEFAREGFKKTVHVYSSKAEAWSDNKPELACYDAAPDRYPSVCVNGMLYLLLNSKDKLLVLDVEGNIQKIIPLPAVWEKWTTFDCIGWSQGCLHYISTKIPDDEEEIDGDGCGHTEPSFCGFLFWVLEDYERQQWVLKCTVSFSKLFGDTNAHEEIECNYKVLGIHPDNSLVFLVRLWDAKVISYNVDTKEVRDLCTLEHGYECITPYVPCFSELLVLDNEQ